MKKIIAVLVITVLSVSLFAAVSSTGTLAGGYTEGNTDPFIYYEFTPGTDADSFEIGFSSSPVSSFDDVTPLSSATQTMDVIQGTFKGVLNSVYVYWQIASNKDTTITLTATAMKDKNNPDAEDYLDVTLSTTAGTTTSTRGEDGTVIASAVTDVENSKENTGVQTILTYTASTFKNQCAGSQLVKLETSDFYSKDGTITYQGTLTVSIATQS